MSPFEQMMSTEVMDEEKRRMVAEQLRSGSATGGRLATSSLEPIQAQGNLMQRQANVQAEQVGLMQARAMADETDQKSIESMLAGKLAASSGKNWAVKASGRDLEKFEKGMQEAASISESAARWKDEFAGLPLGGGVLTNSLVALGIGTDEMKDQAGWWGDWKGFYENITRNGLFGSALTAPEIKQWKKANITESMNADTVRRKLDIATRFIQRKAAAMAASRIDRGWDANAVVNMASRYGAVPQEALQNMDTLDSFISNTNRSLRTQDPITDYQNDSDSATSIEDLTDEELELLSRGS